MHRYLLTLLVLMGVGCGPKIPARDIVEQPWTTDDGKEEIRITLAERLISSGRESTGLALLAGLEQEGSKHPDIDFLQALGQMAQGMNVEATSTLEAYAANTHQTLVL